MASEGYMLLAVGQQKYADMALACARSLRLLAGRIRPIQLVVDSLIVVTDALRRSVDHVDVVELSSDLPATLNKLRIWDLSRFDSTMFVDVDCLLLKSGVEQHWLKLRSYDVAIPGRKLTTGEWYKTDIADLIAQVGIPYIVQMNSGVIYFKKSEQAQALFSEAIRMLRQHGGLIKQRHGTGAHGDEPFLGLALGALGMKPYPINDPQSGELMLSTIGGSEFSFDLTGWKCSYKKGSQLVSPNIVHFVGLEPRREYERLVDALETRNRYALEGATAT